MGETTKLSDSLQAAISAIRDGDKARGQRLLAQLLLADPGDEMAWLWLAAITDHDERRRECLERVLRINPNREAARQGRQALEGEEMARVHADRAPAPPEAEPAVPQPARSIAGAEAERHELDEGVEQHALQRWPAAGLGGRVARLPKPRPWRAMVLVGLLVVLAVAGGALGDNPLAPGRTGRPTPPLTPMLEPGPLAQEEYAARIMQISLSYAQAMDILSERMNAAIQDQRLLADTRWQNDLLTASAILKANGESVRGLQAPAGYSGVQRDIRTAALHFDQVAEQVTAFVLDDDLEGLGRATIEMELGKEAIQRATQKLGNRE